MGGMTLLVIGDDWRDQLDRYQSIEYAEASNRHIVGIDCLPAALKTYERVTPGQPFPAWACRQYGVRVVAHGREPDIEGDDRFGWMRLNDAGEVTELISRDIPGSFYFYFRGSDDSLPLKPGATGWDIRADGTVAEVTAGGAGSARLRDIDQAAIAQCKERVWPHDVIHDGTHLESPDMDALLAGLAPDTLLTVVLAKC